MGIEKLLSVETNHVPHGFGPLLVSKKYGRLFYTSDTRFCQNVVNYAQGVKLLISEQTLQNGLEKDATEKRHMTTN